MIAQNIRAKENTHELRAAQLERKDGLHRPSRAQWIVYIQCGQIGEQPDFGGQGSTEVIASDVPAMVKNGQVIALNMGLRTRRKMSTILLCYVAVQEVQLNIYG